MSLLDDILVKLDAMPADRLDALKERYVAERPVWLPNPGWQTVAINSLADEMFFGGEPGGGKSFLTIGAAVTRHKLSIVFRREFSQIKGLEEAAETILKTRDGYNASNHIWRIPGPDGRVLEFGSVPHEANKTRYQGRAHDLKCVAPDTPVLLPDGSFKPIREIVTGDLVQTLDGPRKVTAIHHVKKPAVRLSAFGEARVSQVQSATHEVLTQSGWCASGWSTTSPDVHDIYRECGSGEGRSLSRNSRGKSSGFSPPPRYAGSPSSEPATYSADSIQCSRLWDIATGCPRALRYAAGLLSMVQESCSRLGIQSWGLWPIPSLATQGWGRRDLQGLSVFVARQGQGSDCEVFDGLRQEFWRLASMFGLPGRAGRVPGADVPSASLRRAERGAYDGRTYSEPPSSPAHCSSEHHLCDGRAPRVLAGVLLSVLPRDDAAPQSPTSLQGDGQDSSHTHSRCMWSYDHPYTKETRQTEQPVRVASFHVDYIGSRSLIDLTVDDANHYITQHGFINRNCFDEITQFTKSQYKYLTLWLRSTDPKQRTRVIATGNPPDSPGGLWVIEYWAPWLDRNHHDPAEPGELRWPVPVEEGSDKEVFFRTIEAAMEHVSQFKKPPVDHEGKLLPPRSRTFVPGKLEENPEYVKSGYQSVLAYTSKDLQGLAAGDFKAGLKDHPNQTIPSSWIDGAQQRWTPRPPAGAPMTAIGVDVAQGGGDETVLAPRHDAWFAPLIAVPGVETPNPSDVSALVVKNRRDQAAVIVDCGGGYGGGVVEFLGQNGIASVPHKGAKKAHGRTKDRQHSFVNKRAEVWWRFREALDPDQFGGSPVALPDDAAVRSDLAAPHFFITPRGIQIEDKDETKKRIGRSPDRGDAIVMSWSEGQEALRRGISGPGSVPGMPGGRDRPTHANVGHASAKRHRRA